MLYWQAVETNKVVHFPISWWAFFSSLFLGPRNKMKGILFSRTEWILLPICCDLERVSGLKLSAPCFAREADLLSVWLVLSGGMQELPTCLFWVLLKLHPQKFVESPSGFRSRPRFSHLLTTSLHAYHCLSHFS